MEVTGDLCKSCGAGKPRYKCPGCGIRTCSLACVKDHKRKSSCLGMRSKTKFVALSEFNTAQLLSDYQFLEEAGRIADAAHRGLMMIGSDAGERRQRLQRVRAAARKRGVSLKLLPAGMARHTANTSCTVWNRQQREWRLKWRVKLLFSQIAQEFTEDSVSEDQVLGDILKRYIHPSESDPILRHRLRVYVGQEVTVFLKSEQVYHQLDLQASLGDSLRGRTLLEFPELLITLSSAAANYKPQPISSSLARLATDYHSEGEGT